MEAHTIWSKGSLLRILTISTVSKGQEVGIRRHYSDWGSRVTQDGLFKRGMLNEIVVTAVTSGGRENWKHFRHDGPIEDAIASFCKSAKKAGFTCHKAITLNGEPVGVSADDLRHM